MFTIEKQSTRPITNLLPPESCISSYVDNTHENRKEKFRNQTNEFGRQEGGREGREKYKL